MKYLFFGLALLLALGVFCYASGEALSGRFANVIAPLERSVDAAVQGQNAQAKSLADAAFSAWEGNYRLLAAFLDHNDIDDVTLAFASLRDAPEEDFLSSCRALLAMLNNLEEADLLLAHNLL